MPVSPVAATGTSSAITAATTSPATLPLPSFEVVTVGLKRLDRSEVRRRMLHMLPGLLPFLLWYIPHKDPWGPIIANVTLGLFVTIVGGALVQFAAFARPGERNGFSSVFGYAIPVLGSLCLFRGREELGLMTLAILAFGDGSATLGGLTLGGRPLPWNSRKTVTGLLCFLVCGGLMSTIIYWGEARPTVPWSIAFALAGTSTLVAGLLETLPSRINDNLRVGLSAATVGGIMQYWLVG